jgi:hypothetical protein
MQQYICQAIRGRAGAVERQAKQSRASNRPNRSATKQVVAAMAQLVNTERHTSFVRCINLCRSAPKCKLTTHIFDASFRASVKRMHQTTAKKLA